MIQVCKYERICKYATGHLVPEQRGRIIGKGPLPNEKLMKAQGEVSLHCEILWLYGFILKNDSKLFFAPFMAKKIKKGKKGKKIK